MSAWLARACTMSDEEGVRALFQRVFDRHLSSAEWRWKLRTLPTPVENEWVAEADGRIVGHYAVMPVGFHVEGEQVLVPHGCDAMTDPAFRRRGILTALGFLANEAWRGTDAPFQIGFPSDAWGSVRERLGWRPVVRLRWHKRWLHPARAILRRAGLVIAPAAARPRDVERRYAGLRIVVPSADDQRFTDLWQRLAPSFDVAAARTAEWARWRCFDRPGVEQRVLMALRDGAPVGYLAYRVHARTAATILDLVTAPDDRAASVLLHAAEQEWRQRRLEKVMALAADRTPLQRAYAAAGFRTLREGFDLSIISLHGRTPPPADRWFLTGAEGDVV